MSDTFDKMRESALKSLQNPGQADTPMPKVEDESKPTLYLFRHCETEDNVNRIFSGKRQTKLTEKGREQAQQLAQKLKDKKIDVFMTSSLIRCIDTITPTVEMHPEAEYIVKEGLNERDYGILTGKSKMEIMEQYPKEAVLWRRSWDVPPPEGESLKTVWETRLESFAKELNQMLKDGKTVAFCGSNNTLRLLRMFFEKLTVEETLEIEMGYGDFASYHAIEE